MCKLSRDQVGSQKDEQTKEILSPDNIWFAGQYYGRDMRPNPDDPNHEEIERLLMFYYCLISKGAENYRKRKEAERAAKQLGSSPQNPENAS